MGADTCFGFVLIGEFNPIGQGEVEVENITEGYPIAGKTEDDVRDVAMRLAKGRDWTLILNGDELRVVAGKYADEA